jgi:hypothetical protein
MPAVTALSSSGESRIRRGRVRRPDPLTHRSNATFRTAIPASERGPGQDLWYNDFCVSGVAAMSRGSLPGLFW